LQFKEILNQYIPREECGV
jgi:hypothetical protein